ncbi:MAG: DNA-binding transcriptional regulator OxyR, partial [Aeromonas sp.]
TISLLYRHYSVRRPCFNELAASIATLMSKQLAQ